jgi:MtN3 and saliva related transmembrane protein
MARPATIWESGSARREAVHIIEGTEGFMTEVIGWFSSFILVLTIAKQVHTQWKSGSSEGVSQWLFVGQITASIGFTLYSVLVGNWVFVVTNSLLLLSAIAGGLIVLKHRRAERRGTRAVHSIPAPRSRWKGGESRSRLRSAGAADEASRRGP